MKDKTIVLLLIAAMGFVPLAAALTMQQYRESRPPVKLITDPNEIIWRTDFCEVNYDRERCTAKTS